MKMTKETKLKIAKDLIQDGRVLTLSDLFDLVPKTVIALGAGIKYSKFLSKIKNPKRLTHEDAIAIANVVGVSAVLVSKLIYNQLEGAVIQIAKK